MVAESSDALEHEARLGDDGVLEKVELVDGGAAAVDAFQLEVESIHRNLKARWFLGNIASDPSRHLDGTCACAHVGAENLAKL